jgi:diaminopimelate epimerase
MSIATNPIINFCKYEGTGNDFIVINNLHEKITLSASEISRLCNRHTGIGADGLILLEQSDIADCFMNYYNSDGTNPEMCGNGARCTARFFKDQMKSELKVIKLETRAGVKNIEINEDDSLTVNMDVPIFESPDFPTNPNTASIDGLKLEFVSMGNPHAVTFIKDLNNLNINEIGPKIENNILFPNRINVEFVEKISNDYYKVRVWERGCGETFSCGTGACAVFAILNKLSARQGLAEKENTLEFPGGKLFLSKNEQGHVILRGPATFVFEGEIEIRG